MELEYRLEKKKVLEDLRWLSDPQMASLVTIKLAIKTVQNGKPESLYDAMEPNQENMEYEGTAIFSDNPTNAMKHTCDRSLVKQNAKTLAPEKTYCLTETRYSKECVEYLSLY